MLRTIYRQLTSTTVDCPRYGSHWETIGFQGTDPSTDLRGVGILGLVQQYCLIYAVALESPSTVTIIRQMQIILAYIVQAVMFHVMPSSMDMLGASLILTTVVAVSFEEQISIWLGCLTGTTQLSGCVLDDWQL